MDLLSILSQSAQMVGAVFIAVLIWPVARVIRTQYLEYWAWAWVFLAVSLIAHFFSVRNPALGIPLHQIFCLGEYGFVFLLWAGSHTYATGRAVRILDLGWLVPAVAYGFIAPLACPSFSLLFGWHAVIMTGFFAYALWETGRFHPRTQSPLGFRLYQGALLGLTLLFAHYAVLLVYQQFYLSPDRHFEHLTYASLYEMVLQAGLSLGMVTIATERMRAELLGANAKLAEAAVELDLAARTDPLTGLLNRRGLNDLLRHPERVPPGCLAVIDVTDLKVVNDRFGHEVGDVALQLIARALRNLFRVTDPLFRLGGDEFLILMPGGSEEELIGRLRSLDETLLGHRLSGHVSHPVDVRIAWGVAQYASAETIQTAIALADESMYNQKKLRKGGLPR